MTNIKPLLKTPLPFYWGKQKMLKYTLPLMLPSIVGQTYIGVYAGGDAEYWAREQVRFEILNDTNGNIPNFYKIVQSDFDELRGLINDTICSEYTYHEAKDIYLADRDKNNKVLRAWSTWVVFNMSFSYKPCAGWLNGFQIKDNSTKPINLINHKKDFDRIKGRLDKAEIHNKDGIQLMKLLNARSEAEKYFYRLDPPYTKEAYEELFEILPSIKGKWLLSSYPSEELTALRLNNKKWNYEDIKKPLSVTGKAGRTKTECLTWNYDLIENQMELF